MEANAKHLRQKAEKAGVWLALQLGCAITRKAIRTKWQAVDFFGSDIVGKMADGSHVYIQVTAGQYSAVTARRRKLEKIPWHPSDAVLIAQLVGTQDPANARRKKHFFRVHEYAFWDRKDRRSWQTWDQAIDVPREWLERLPPVHYRFSGIPLLQGKEVKKSG